jgi:flagellar assembly protein FliH
MADKDVTSVRKFMFETDFDALPVADAGSAARAEAKHPLFKPKAKEPPPPPAEPAPPPPPPEPTFSEAEVKAASDKARAEGTKAGEAKGRATAMAEIEQRIASALTAMQGQVTAMQQDAATDRATILSEATTIALAILEKMLPAYTRQGGLAEIEAVLTRCLLDQRREQRLVVRVSPDLLPALEPRIQGLSGETGFEGRLFLIADERLGAADCSVEWADGGLERHADAIWRDVSAALDRCLALQGIPAPAELNSAETSETAPAPGSGNTESVNTETAETETAEPASEDLTRSE